MVLKGLNKISLRRKLKNFEVFKSKSDRCLKFVKKIIYQTIKTQSKFNGHLKHRREIKTKIFTSIP